MTMRYLQAMQTSLRKMGNSTGLIVPAAILRQMGLTAGAAVDLRVEDGSVIATPVHHPRAGWAESAALIAAAELGPDERDWTAFGNEGDAELNW